MNTNKRSQVLKFKNLVFVCGLNTSGRLGIQNTCEKIISTPVDISKFLSPHQIESVSIGTSFNFFLSKNSVHACGNGEKYQFASENSENLLEPSFISSLSKLKIIQISSCDYKNLGVSENGKVYEWGICNYDSNYTVRYPSVIPLNHDCISVVCGMDQGYAITKSKQLICWGTKNNLGMEYDRYSGYCSPVLHPSFKHKQVKKILTYFETLLLTETGDVYYWGSHPRSNERNSTPSLIETNFKVMDIALGLYHCILLSTHGEVYVMGSNGSGQLGLDICIKKSLKPTKLNALSKHFISSVSAFLNRSVR
jgi:alpha-tubulin suppressor-like RCC1 family protein